MSAQDDGGPAFPIVFPSHINEPGTTLRDWYAGQAPSIPEWFQRNEWDEEVIMPAPDMGRGYVRKGVAHRYEEAIDHLTRWRYAYADAMLAARKAKQ